MLHFFFNQTKTTKFLLKMKKTLLLWSFVALVVSCDKKKEAQPKDAEVIEHQAAEQTPSTGAATAPEFQKGADLIAQNDCSGCHKVDEKLTGPSFKEIAAKYTTADVATLSKSIIDGSKGKWGEIPMTAHPSLSQEDASEMVKYILSNK